MKHNILNSIRNNRLVLAMLTALTLASWASEAKAGTLYWNTNGTSASITSANWGTSASGPYTTAWATTSNIVFTTNSTATFATTAVGNVTVSSGAAVTVTAGGSLTLGGVRTFDIGTGSTLNWVSQSQSTAAGNEGAGVIKNGAGILNWGAGPGSNVRFNGGLTLNDGTVIVSAANSLSSGALKLNGGTLQSSGTTAFTSTSITIGGDFTLTGTGNNNWDAATTIALGASTRTIANNTTAGSRQFRGLISGSAGAGLTFAGAGAAQIYIGNTGNTFDGPVAINGGDVVFNGNGAFGNATSITLDGGRLTMASMDTVGTNSALTAATIGSGKNIFMGATAGTSISVTGTNGVTTYNGVIADKSGATGAWAKQGAGLISLGGASTYTGATAINNGTIQLTTGDDRLPTGTVVSLGQAASSNLGTLDLNGRNQKIAGLVSTSGSNTNVSLKNTVTSVSAATLEINVGNGTTNSYGLGTAANSGVITGSVALNKSGLGTQLFGDANTYTGTTTVSGGTLAVNGSLLNSGSVVVNSGAFLGGSGSVGNISGAGTINPGNSPGILTATSVNPSAGTAFNFEFTALAPTYSSATASLNDLLHLTGATPFGGGAFSSGNIISIYLNSTAISDSLIAGVSPTVFSGGFFVDGTYGLASALSGATFAYYTSNASLGTGSAVDYNGVSYYLLNSDIVANTSLSDAAVTGAGFSTGTVSGTMLTFTAVPEPSAQTLFGFGVISLFAVRAIRRGRRDS
ncbi:MAG: autotransporter-associated beta strand repeat-containing protein [Verrucomicrobia bacterium]|nr:autotransporter-associated beta strand repeat-containing protein [Verrucomicrobiota bacterium]